MQDKKQQLQLDIEQQSGSKSGKEYVKAVYCHPAYLTYMQSTSYEILGWMTHKLESRLQGEISTTSDIQMIPPSWQKVKRNERASWWRCKRSEKPGLKSSIQKLRSRHLVPSLHGAKMGTQWRQFSWAPKSLWVVTAATKLKDACSLEEKLWQMRQCIKKQRHHFADKGLYGQSYGFSSSHVWMWELDHKEVWVPKN